MALWPPSRPSAERRAAPSSFAPPEDPARRPPGGKRPRLEDPGGGPGPGWRPPPVWRPSAAARAWAWPWRPLRPLLVAAAEGVGGGADAAARPAGRAPCGRRGRGGGERGREGGRGPEGAGAGRTGPAPPRGEESRAARGPRPSRREGRNLWPSVPRTPAPQSQPGREAAKPGCSGERLARSVPGFRTDSQSDVASVCVKKIAKGKNDKFEAYVRDFTNIDWSQNRHDVKRQKVQNDKKVVNAEKNGFEFRESNYQLLSNQNTFERKKHLSSLHCRDHSSIKNDVRDSKKNWKEAEPNPNIYIPANLNKSQSRYCTITHILKGSRQNSWVMKNHKTKSESMKRPREKLDWLLLQEIELLGKGYCNSTKAINIQEQQSNPLIIEMIDNHKFLMNIVWLNSKGENNMLQLRCYTIQKDFHISNSCQNFITDFYSLKSISGNQKDNSILSWCQVLKCKNEVGIQNLISSNNVNMSDILSKYLQTTVSEPLNIIFKTNVPYMFSSFYSLAKIENDSELGYIFKWLIHLDYPKLLVVEGHTVDLMRILTVSTLLENIMKPLLKGRRPGFKIQQILERSKKENFGSFSTTAKNLASLIFEIYKQSPYLVEFNDMGELSLIKETCYENMSCLEQNVNVETWAHYSFSIVIKHIKSDPQFAQENHGCINGKYEDLGTVRKQDPTVSTLTSKHIFEGSYVRQQAILASQDPICSLPINRMTVAQLLNSENLQSEIERTKHHFILKEVKVMGQNSQICFKVEKKEGNFFPKGERLSVQPISLISKRENVEETKSVNQNNTTDESILQESVLTNSKHFHPKNDTLYVNHQFETDSNEGNNECFQNLTEKCLSTEALTIATDFEMKSKFDLVLEELRMFHEISREEEIPTPVETYNGGQNYFEESNDGKEAEMEIEKKLKMVTADKKCASPLPCDIIAGPNIQRRQQSLFKWKAVPNNGEQEVPNVYCYPRTSEQEIRYFTSEQDGKNSLLKRPALFLDECMEEKLDYLSRGGSHFSHGISRVRPLKTCNRPIRIGLSRKARFKQLHPYLKETYEN